jgi:hypothetical protein
MLVELTLKRPLQTWVFVAKITDEHIAKYLVCPRQLCGFGMPYAMT